MNKTAMTLGKLLKLLPVLGGAGYAAHKGISSFGEGMDNLIDKKQKLDSKSRDYLNKNIGVEKSTNSGNINQSTSKKSNLSKTSEILHKLARRSNIDNINIPKNIENVSMLLGKKSIKSKPKIKEPDLKKNSSGCGKKHAMIIF